MLVSGIKSRPVYPGLEPDPYAKQNLIVADAEGVKAVADMFKRATPEFAERSILLTAGAVDLGAFGDGLRPANIWAMPSLDTAINRLAVTLSQARMGLRLYVAGPEPLIARAVQAAMDHGIEHQSIFTEHRGSTKRRVQCVHCKGITDDVTTNPVKCAHCGTLLLVRDHFSRRLGAFMGVRIDAEAPGEPVESLGDFK
ncbi:MAG: hypothetical protein KDJ17_01750 [Hyphomicrobiaceae bacterium]|nr:hypothetical protein [Hyphomicrobiaceae bacterium]